MSFIRKHAAALALLSALLLCIAAPYLIPANPDSAVFRSGTLGAILIAACIFPVRDAFVHADRRQLTAGLVFGFLFAAALSLGSELFVYDGLLRGMGSLVRRLAVPVMAAPLLGGLSARALMLRIPQEKKTLSLPVWGYAAILFLCWLPVLLAFFPGMLNYDFPGQYAQHVDKAYSALHPLLYSVLSNGIISLGEKIHSPTLGVLLLSVIQMALFAGALGYSCSFAQKHGAPRWVLALLTAFYALHPIFAAMSVSMAKDTLFSAAVLVFSLESWSMIEDTQAFFKSRWRLVFYVLLGIVTALFRKNGVFALVMMLPALLVILRSFRKHAAVLFGVLVLCITLIDGSLTMILQPESTTSFQLYSLPAQQLVRAAQNMSEEDRAEIRSWYVSDEGMLVHPHLADGAKGYLDRERIQTDGASFLKLWGKHAGTHAHEYLEAFLMLNVGSWYPDDLSHSNVYDNYVWNDLGYLQLQEQEDPYEAFGIQTRSFLPSVTTLYERICRRNYYQKYPIISILFCPATPFWVLLFACAQLIVRKKRRFLPAALGAFGLWLSYLFGPCTLVRYALPLFCLAPVLLIISFTAHLEKETTHA